MSSTRDCPSCGREAGFHLPSCCFEATDELAPIKTRLEALYAECAGWARRGLSRWAPQLAQDVGRALGTARWLEIDIERERLDRELQKKETTQP